MGIHPATPLIDQGRVYMLGGHGDLHCVSLADGKTVWSRHLPRDFGAAVPTWGYCSSPLAVDGKLIVNPGGKLVLASENNGTRIYDFDRDGSIRGKPIAVNEDLSPDSSTPVLVGGRLFGCWYSLHCLHAEAKPQALWTGEDDAFGHYASLIASADRVLVISNRGELLLVDATAGEYKIVSRHKVLGEEAELLSHPALVGSRLYLRDTSRIVSLELLEPGTSQPP